MGSRVLVPPTLSFVYFILSYLLSFSRINLSLNRIIFGGRKGLSLFLGRENKSEFEIPNFIKFDFGFWLRKLYFWERGDSDNGLTQGHERPIF